MILRFKCQKTFASFHLQTLPNIHEVRHIFKESVDCETRMLSFSGVRV